MNNSTRILLTIIAWYDQESGNWHENNFSECNFEKVAYPEGFICQRSMKKSLQSPISIIGLKRSTQVRKSSSLTLSRSCFDKEFEDVCSTLGCSYPTH